MGRTMKRKIHMVFLISWIIIIMVLTGYPTLETPKIREFPIDKLYHFIIFFILGALELGLLKTRHFFLLGCGVVVVAEVQQIFIPGREFEILDIIAGLLGLIVIYLLFKKRSPRNDLSKA
jgi:VanZ family protein